MISYYVFNNFNNIVIISRWFINKIIHILTFCDLLTLIVPNQDDLVSQHAFL